MRSINLFMALTMAAMLTQFASAAGLGWVLNGTITNAATCATISGAKVSSPYNNYAFNISNSKGYYNLILGTGNWSVTVSAAGYNNGSYLTPYISTGVLSHNFSLVPTGGSARSTPCSKNSTVINQTSTTITPGVNPNTTTSVAVTNSTGSGNSGMSGTTWIIIGVIVVIVIIAAALMMRKKPPQHHEHHQQQEHHSS